jgi:NTP pyrophosphatase (non-canonical NTP hydrolase)
VYEDNEAKGFWEDYEDMEDLICTTYKSSPDILRRSIKNHVVTTKLAKIGLMHSELSESLEAIRKDLMDDKITDMSGEVVELADTVIRIMDYAGAFNLPLAEAIERKLKYNRGRKYKHGKQA